MEWEPLGGWNANRDPNPQNLDHELDPAFKQPKTQGWLHVEFGVRPEGTYEAEALIFAQHHIPYVHMVTNVPPLTVNCV